MSHYREFYIDGAWAEPAKPRTLEVIDPATEEAFETISLGSAADVDRAVAAARAAFPTYAAGSREERIALLERIMEVYEGRKDEIAAVISREMGCPIAFSRAAQAPVGLTHMGKMIEVLRDYRFEEQRGGTLVVQEPIGVCGLITPWNWPINQLVCKVLPALAAGCSMVFKPSELAPLSASIVAEVLHEAGVPKGVFNLVNGDGDTVGAAISAHPGIDMISFTGSTRAGVAIAKAAAPSVKRVCQELGGKAPNLILPDADFPDAVSKGVLGCFRNNGQSCSAPTRMLVPEERLDEVNAIARETAEKVVVGSPADEATILGPVISAAQFDKIQRLIQAGIDEGAELVAGGPGRPEGFNRGYYVRPTVFSRVGNDMTIAREEIFGPVLSIIPYRDEEDAIRIANDTDYGLTAYVQSGDLEHAGRVARSLRAGSVLLNYAPVDPLAPFGGFKQSGNGREYGIYGLSEFLELKGIVGYAPAG